MSEPIHTRLKRLRLSAKMTQQEVADAVGISRVAVSKWESGQTKDLKHDNLRGLAKLYRVTLEELLSGEGPMRDAAISPHRQPDANVTPVSLRGKRVPLLSTVPAGNWREIVDDYLVGGAPDYDVAYEDVGEHGFALTVDGDSMAPDYRAGDTIFINPDIQAMPGDLVVARNHKFEATFKRYRPRGLNERGEEYFELIPINEDYPPMRSDLTPIEIIGVVVEHRRKVRRPV